jgi:hypothetical protein
MKIKENTQYKKGLARVQVVECLSSKHEAQYHHHHQKE